MHPCRARQLTLRHLRFSAHEFAWRASERESERVFGSLARSARELVKPCKTAILFL